MDGKTIEVQKRSVFKSRENRRQRRLGQIPASINIKGQESVAVAVNESALRSAMRKHGRAAVLKLKAGKETYSVMVRDIDLEPLTSNYLSVVFQQVSMSEEIKINIGISLKGTDMISMKQLNISQQHSTLPVSGLAADIPNTVEIDVSNLENGDSVYVKDLVLPGNITVELDPDQLLLSVGMQRVHAESDTQEEAGEKEEASAQ